MTYLNVVMLFLLYTNDETSMLKYFTVKGMTNTNTGSEIVNNNYCDIYHFN